jgi:hypothetical protein
MRVEGERYLLQGIDGPGAETGVPPPEARANADTRRNVVLVGETQIEDQGEMNGRVASG